MTNRFHPFSKPPHAIVSVLDDEHYAIVERLWLELERELGIRRIMGEASFPHFSYHGAQDYNLDQLEPVLKKIASTAASFRIQTSGLGIFNLANPVVYIPIARNPALNTVHRMVWDAVGSVGLGALSHYHPERWLPHITLAYRDTSRENLPDIIRFLIRYDYLWEIEIDNIALVYNTDHTSALRFRFHLSGDRVVVD